MLHYLSAYHELCLGRILYHLPSPETLHAARLRATQSLMLTTLGATRHLDLSWRTRGSDQTYCASQTVAMRDLPGSMPQPRISIATSCVCVIKHQRVNYHPLSPTRYKHVFHRARPKLVPSHFLKLMQRQLQRSNKLPIAIFPPANHCHQWLATNVTNL